MIGDETIKNAVYICDDTKADTVQDTILYSFIVSV